MVPNEVPSGQAEVLVHAKGPNCTARENGSDEVLQEIDLDAD